MHVKEKKFERLERTGYDARTSKYRLALPVEDELRPEQLAARGSPTDQRRVAVALARHTNDDALGTGALMARL
jgi:hypothetical protein